MKSKIAWKFFGAFLFLTLIAVFVLNFFASLKLRDHFEQKISEKLQSNAMLVGNILKRELREASAEDIQRQIDVLADDLDLRITIIDKEGKVLDVRGEVIPGLYAAGNASAQISGLGYYGGGGTIGSGMTWGYICGITLAREVNSGKA